MFESIFSEIVAVVALSGTVALAGLSFRQHRLSGRRAEAEWSLLEQQAGGDGAVVFRGNLAVAASGVLAHLCHPVAPGIAWATLVDDLSDEFPDLASILMPGDAPTGVLASFRNASTLTVERAGRLTRLTLAGSAHDAGDTLLQSWLAEATGTLAWREDGAGRILWANAAYLRFTEGDAACCTWPPPNLLTGTDRRRLRQNGHAARVGAVGADGARAWFSVTAHRLEGAWTYAGVDQTARVGAEQAAQSAKAALAAAMELSERAVALIDPFGVILATNTRMAALTQPTGPGRRPSDIVDILAALDPAGVASLGRRADAIRQGKLDESWTLPNGREIRANATRVQGDLCVLTLADAASQHAMAPIDEIAAAFDSLETAIAIFGPDGRLAAANAACRALWGWSQLPVGPLRDAGTVCDAWSRECAPGAVWSILRGALSDRTRLSPVTLSARHRDGRGLVIALSRIEAGGAVVRFEIASGSTLTPASSLPAP